MDRIKLFLILDLIYRHKTLKSLAKKGVSLDEAAEEIWLASDKGYVEETKTGFRLTRRGIDQYLQLRVLFRDSNFLKQNIHSQYDEASKREIPLQAII